MSTLKVTNIHKTGESVSRDVNGVAAAWVIFQPVSGTPVLNSAMNVSSITDWAVGTYGANFSSSFSTSNHVSVVSTWQSTNANGVGINVSTPTASSQTIETREGDGLVDSNHVNLSVHGDLS